MIISIIRLVVNIRNKPQGTELLNSHFSHIDKNKKGIVLATAYSR